MDMNGYERPRTDSNEQENTLTDLNNKKCTVDYRNTIMERDAEDLSYGRGETLNCFR